MTPEQKRLARHALGLPNKAMVSYRNRYVIPHNPDVVPFLESMKLMSNGYAEACGLNGFKLTRAGAERALEPGESLCKEDFPDD